ncbi:Aspartate kinase LysC [Candidatus Bodocaedibacter vickermanii]|uniref:Aspartokinase n=2 Tax=Candidatus Bodocaedibacter vickermanii TaxID=2741701 RepID=A0A7L9RUH5_9PROT|nr:Aspartate kinase LysC [Candidatus Paracaedibacteraceae bacterium 'Lake Konstanz']
MSIIVQKYGGTSVGSVERMRHVADLIIAERNAGHQVVVVASAMAGATNQLVKSAQQFNNAVGTPAYDFVVSTGENVSCGMLALALAEKDVHAMPMAGWQVPIRTNELHSKARIIDIDPTYLHQVLQNGIVPIITGFQGMGSDQRLTTLGRGGSDTSAVAIAAALRAIRCDIYTDIDGMYTADPRVVAKAQFISEVPYTVAYHMAELGAKVIHPRAVECCMQANIPLRILSSFGSDKFTTLINQPAEPRISGIAHTHNNVLYKVQTHDPETGGDILDRLNGLDIPFDMMLRNDTSLQFCGESADDEVIKDVLASYKLVVSREVCAKISAVGAVSTQYFEQILQQFKAQNIHVVCCWSDDVRVSVLVSMDQMEQAVNILHAIFFNF